MMAGGVFTAYNLVKFLHVLLAIVAVGFNASYGIWVSRAAREPQHLSRVLRGIKFLDDRFANPAYGLLAVTGITMVLVGRLSLTTFWIAAGLVLWAVVVVLGLAVYTPTLRAQIGEVEAAGPDSTSYLALSRRATAVGIGLAVLLVVIVFDMVTKPTF